MWIFLSRQYVTMFTHHVPLYALKYFPRDLHHEVIGTKWSLQSMSRIKAIKSERSSSKLALDTSRGWPLHFSVAPSIFLYAHALFGVVSLYNRGYAWLPWIHPAISEPEQHVTLMKEGQREGEADESRARLDLERVEVPSSSAQRQA